MPPNDPVDESPTGQGSNDEFPEWYQEEHRKLDARVVVKFHTPDGSLTWVAKKLDGDDVLFELVVGLEIELWNFSDDETQYLRSAMGAPVECHTYFEFKSLRDFMDIPESES